ncbi:MAG: hypothetical protein Q9182_007549, partial [Xanthomendoza sp. 2 TL-2023]
NVSTPSRATTTTGSSFSTPTTNSKQPSLAPGNVRSYMEEHGLFVDKHILDRPAVASFREHVMQVIDYARPSAIKAESERRWQKRTENLQLHNEATMLDFILPNLIKINRQVPAEDPFARDPFTRKDSSAQEDFSTPPESSNHQEASGHQSADEVMEDFIDDGMTWNVDCEFQRTYLPNAYRLIGYEKEIATILAKERGIKNPKPDRIYGRALGSIPAPALPMLRDETKQLLNIVPNMNHPFFIIEGVQSNGTMAKAINQACRGGTVAVYTQRLLLAATNQPCIDEGPDHENYVYTATINDTSMSFYVTFAFIHEGNVAFHMEHIYTNAFRAKDGLLYLRRICHNILDWGLRTRRPMLEQRCALMYEFDRLAILQDAHEARLAEAAVAAERDEVRKSKKPKLAPGKVHKSF